MPFLQVPLGRQGVTDWSAEQRVNLCFSTCKQTGQRRFSAEASGEGMPFKACGLVPKSAADFAFPLHGFHVLKLDG